MSITTFIRKKILWKLIDLRLLSSRKTPPDEIIRIELLIVMCISSLMFGAIYIITGLFLNISLLSILNYLIYLITIVPATLLLIKKGYHNIAKLLMLLLGTLFMVIKASSLGPHSGMNISMLIILAALFAFYGIRDYGYIILGIIIITISIVFLEYTNYSFLSTDSATSTFEYIFNYTSTIFFCILFSYVVLRINQYNNNKLTKLNQKFFYKNRKLEKINDELDSYVYRVTHDMRSPLTSLMGIISMIKKEELAESTQKLIGLQENCVNKLDNHIKQIIALSRNAKTELNIESIQFDEMIQEIFEELNFLECASQIKKTIQINQTTKFYSDPYRLKIILSNLISNSIKYLRKDIDPEIYLSIIISDFDAAITIRDNGIGIATDHQSKVFDMFYRATEKSTGSGLGLYIVKEMILKLQGSIAVSSEVNNFTTIRFVLPNIPEHTIFS